MGGGGGVGEQEGGSVGGKREVYVNVAEQRRRWASSPV